MSNLSRPTAVTRPNKIPYFKRSTLAACIMAASSGAWAQTDSNTQIEEVVVQGVRGALQNAQEMKRDSATVVDAISASDINALPDKSVLEALQRVPGISIERFAAADDPDHFTIEGSGITLRGMPQTRSEFNGRDSFSANSGRGLSFQDVPPELMGAVEVYKNHTADMTEGGISGTINLNTRKPFDSAEQQIAINGALNYTDFAEETSPDLSALFSDRWETEVGEFGLLVSLANSKLKNRYDSVQNGVNTLVDVVGVGERWTPINVAVRTTEQERERNGGNIVLQWADPSETMLGTLEYMRSDATQTWIEHGIQSDDVVGTASADSVYNNNQFVSGTLEGANPYNSFTRKSDKNSLVEDFSLNLLLTPSEKWTIELDAQYVKASTQLTDLSIFGALAADAYVNLDRDVADIRFMAPSGSTQTDGEYFSDPSNYFYRAAMDHVEDSDGDEKAFKMDVEYHIDDGWFRSVKGGVRIADRSQTTRWSKYNWGVLSESWAGGKKNFDGVYENSSGDEPYDAPAYLEKSLSNFYRGETVGVNGGNILSPGTQLVASYGSFVDNLSSIFGFASLGTRADVVQNYYLPVEINDTLEKNRAAYMMLNFGSPDDTWVGNVGLRYVSVSNETSGGSAFPDLSTNALPLPADDLAFSNGASYPSTENSDSDQWLPSLNLKYNINENWLARVSVSKAVSYPDLGNLRNFMSVSAIVDGQDTTGDGNDDSAVVNEYRASAGNPFLEPMESINYDATVEWYFDDVGAVTAGVFYKDLSNFFASGSYPRYMTNNGVTKVVDVEGPINTGEASIKGVELAYQQFFDDLPGPWSGLGVQANYTYVSASDVPNQNLNPAKGDEPVQATSFDNLPLQGMSEHTYNLVGMYEYQDIAARLAWNWRSDYLLTTRDVITKAPIYSQASGQLDGSLFYSINDNFKVGVEASNLLNEITKTKMQVDQEGTQLARSWFVNDRRFSLVLRANF